jgi:iron-sulfur cluster assembly accessory protein
MIFIRSLGRSAPIKTIIRANISTHQSSSNQQQQHNTTDFKNLINIKDSCLNRLKQILDKPQEEFLRIQVETGGCSGFSYHFNIERNNNLNPDEDLIFERDNYRVVINKEVLTYMKGSSIEYTESLIKSSFQIVNPIAETKCSCGSSFSIDLSKIQNPLDSKQELETK